MEFYLGPRGYTIIKSSISAKEIAAVKNKLLVIPKTFKGVKSFSVYRESANKLYIPRYFGESSYGRVTGVENRIGEGDAIDVAFRGTLRLHQVPAVDAFLTLCSASPVHACGLLELDCAAGKTVLSLKIISMLQKKTLIIVHKEFLLNQWIERIQEFLPTARVGRIQGPVVDIENKDIVIAMLQSLSMKEYDPTLFLSFGLTIIDEVHHISSETFSNALFKITTKYMMGLSATMVRKDGTTNVIKMFLGDVVYKGIKVSAQDVRVRGIEYKSEDATFNVLERDFQGAIKHSTMISKLCAHTPRSDFIVNIVVELLRESPEKQIMVLGQNRSILYYMHDALLATKAATVGYYVGGMKQAALSESSKQQILLCTYAAASEGLDISTLSTLVFVTPKTDIVQSVGRIMRTKGNRPLIVDIVDQHSVFKNQWKKRLAFYRKSNYVVSGLGDKKRKHCGSDSSSDSGSAAMEGEGEGEGEGERHAATYRG